MSGKSEEKIWVIFVEIRAGEDNLRRAMRLLSDIEGAENLTISADPDVGDNLPIVIKPHAEFRISSVRTVIEENGHLFTTPSVEEMDPGDFVLVADGTEAE